MKRSIWHYRNKPLITSGMEYFLNLDMASSYYNISKFKLHKLIIMSEVDLVYIDNADANCTNRHVNDKRTILENTIRKRCREETSQSSMRETRMRLY